MAAQHVQEYAATKIKIREKLVADNRQCMEIMDQFWGCLLCKLSLSDPLIGGRGSGGQGEDKYHTFSFATCLDEWTWQVKREKFYIVHVHEYAGVSPCVWHVIYGQRVRAGISDYILHSVASF